MLLDLTNLIIFMLSTNHDFHLYAIFSSSLFFPLSILNKPFEHLLKYLQFIVLLKVRG